MIQSLYEYALYIFSVFHNHALVGEAIGAFPGYPDLVADRAGVVSGLQVIFILFIAVVLFIGLLTRSFGHRVEAARAAAEATGLHDPVQVLVCGVLMLFWIIGFAAIAASL
jgi:hypothetical protein